MYLIVKIKLVINLLVLLDPRAEPLLGLDRAPEEVLRIVHDDCKNLIFE